MGLLGPNKSESYQLIAESIGGSVTEEESLLKTACISKPYRGITLKMRTYTVSTGGTMIITTYVYAALTLLQPIKVNVYARSFFADLGKKLGMQDIEVGYGPFDDQFIIQGEPLTRVKSFLRRSDIYHFMLDHPKLHFKIDRGKELKSIDKGISKDDPVLYYSELDDLRDIEKVKMIFNFLERLIDGLIEEELIVGSS